MVVRAGNTRTGGGNIDIGKLSLLAAKGLSSPITDILSCSYPCTNIAISKKFLTSANILLKHRFTENVYRSDIFQPSTGQPERVKYIYCSSKVKKCTYGCKCNKLHAAH